MLHRSPNPFAEKNIERYARAYSEWFDRSLRSMPYVVRGELDAETAQAIRIYDRHIWYPGHSLEISGIRMDYVFSDEYSGRIELGGPQEGGRDWRRGPRVDENIPPVPVCVILSRHNAQPGEWIAVHEYRNYDRFDSIPHQQEHETHPIHYWRLTAETLERASELAHLDPWRPYQTNS